MIISERIFDLLQEKRISQKDFSDRTGISQSTISDWKRKKTNPAADKIITICAALEVSPYELLLGVDYHHNPQVDYSIVEKNSEEYFLLDVFRKLDQSDRNRVRAYLQAIIKK